MKLSEAPTKIIGIQVGEVTIDLIRSGVPALKVRLAMFTDEGPVAFMDVGDAGQWSNKSIDAMRAFTEALEEDALRLVFKVPTQDTETTQANGPNEPAQF